MREEMLGLLRRRAAGDAAEQHGRSADWPSP